MPEGACTLLVTAGRLCQCKQVTDQGSIEATYKTAWLSVWERGYLGERAGSQDMGRPHDTGVINNAHLVFRVLCQIRPYKVQTKTCSASTLLLAIVHT